MKFRGKYLLQQRPPSGLLGGMWEWPGGKVLKEQVAKDILKEKVAEQTGIEIEVGDAVGQVSHAYSHFSITVTIYNASRNSGRVSSSGVQATWKSPAQISELPLGKAAIGIAELAGVR